MLFGKSVVFWLIVFLIAICVFFLAQWLVPLVFALVGFQIPAHIVNIIALLIAVGVVYGGYSR